MKTFKRIFCWVVFCLLVLLFTLMWLPFDFILGTNHSTDFSYNNVLKKAYQQNYNLVSVPVTKIALLGSHDALTSEISASSSVDTAQPNNPANAFYSKFAKGLTVRWSKAQQHDIFTQLCAGVRYVDIRVSYINGTYYNAHGLVSGKFENSIMQILKFLDENNGEFVVLHFVHCYLADFTFDDMASFIASVKYNGKNIFDFVNYDKTITNPSSITYGMATDNASKSGVVILSDESGQMESEYADYFGIKKCYSNWKNKIETDTLLKLADEDYNYIKQHPELVENSFCINQLQTTPNFGSAFNSVFTWALTTKAQFHNAMVLNYQNFDKWLPVFPIVMFDYTTSNYKDFNKAINQKLFNYNKML